MDTDPKDQLDKFKEAARQLECDDDEQRFKDRLKRVVHTQPVPDDDGNDKCDT